MQNTLAVHVLDEVDHLQSEQDRRLQREFLLAEAKEVLKRRSQQVHDHYIVLLLGGSEVDIGNANLQAWVVFAEHSQHFGLGKQLLMLIVAACFNFDCYLRFVFDVDAQKDLSEGSLTKLLDKPEVFGDYATQLILHHLTYYFIY